MTQKDLEKAINADINELIKKLKRKFSQAQKP